MTREQLRAQLLANADQASNSLLWRWLTPTQRNLLIAGRQVNSQNTPTVNAYLDLVLAQLNTMQAKPEPPPAKPTAAEIAAMYATLYRLVQIVNPDAMMVVPASLPAPSLPTAEEVSAMLRTVFLLVEITSPNALD